ncbi:TPA: DUF1542 domain-containing protein [Streptococcus suis]|nr:DUF1542 domain-containing protein [Streptococcus suis]
MNRSKKKSFNWYGMRQQFSIRKYHFGAASVLLGMTLVLSAGTIVSAETGVNGDGTSNGQILPVNDAGTSDGTNSTMQPQADNQGVNSSGVQTDNTTNSTANDQSASDTGSASGLQVGTSRSADTGTQGDGATSQPVAEPIIKIPSSASEKAPQGYVTVTFAGNQYTKGFTLGTQNGNSVKVFVKENVTWGTLLNDPDWKWPTVTTASGDTVVGWAVNIRNGQAYNAGNAFAREKYRNTAVNNTKLYPNVVYEVEDVGGNGTKEGYLAQYGPDEQDKWIFITFNAGKGQLKGSKKSKMVAVSNSLYSIDFSNNLFKGKVEAPTLAGHTFVRWQTQDGVVLPKSGTITTETTYEALYLAHPEQKTVVFNQQKLTETEKERLKQAIYDANPDSTGLIESITVSDTGVATVNYTGGTEVTVPASNLIEEDKNTARSLAKADIEKEATEKRDAINASNLTEEEKRAKLEEVNNAQAAADSAIDQANASDELNKALTDGKTAIAGIDTSTSAKKAQAKEDTEEITRQPVNEVIARGSKKSVEEFAPTIEIIDFTKSIENKSITARYQLTNPSQNFDRAVAQLYRGEELVWEIAIANPNASTTLAGLDYYTDYTLKTKVYYSLAGQKQETIQESIRPFVLEYKKIEIKDVDAVTVYRRKDGKYIGTRTLDGLPVDSTELFIKVTSDRFKEVYLPVSDIRDDVKDGQAVYKVTTSLEQLVEDNGSQYVDNKVFYIPKITQETDTYFTFTDLVNAIKANPSGTFKLGTDLYADELPVGDVRAYITETFTGNLTGEHNGSKFAIYNQKAPLFQKTDGATITSLDLKNAQIDSVSHTDLGVLVNMVVKSTLTDIAVEGSIKGQRNYGGIVYKLDTQSRLTNASFKGNITSYGTGESYVGGIAGLSTGSYIDKVKSEVVITIRGENNQAAGGIVGRITGGQNERGINLQNAYATGSITNEGTTTQLGSIVGTNQKGWVDGRINNVIGDVDGSLAVVGSLHSANAALKEAYSTGTDAKAVQISESEAAVKAETLGVTATVKDSNLQTLNHYSVDYQKVPNAKTDYAIAYANMEKILPFYNKELLVYYGNKLSVADKLNTKRLVDVVPMKDTAIVADLPTEKTGINKLMLHYEDGSIDYKTISYKGDFENNHIAEYTIAGLGLIYTPEVFLNARESMINRLVDVLSPIAYDSEELRKVLNPPATASWQTTNDINDLYIKSSFSAIKNDLSSYLRKVLTSSLNGQGVAVEQHFEQKIQENKEAFLLGLSYLDRWYNINYDSLNTKDLTLYKQDFFGNVNASSLDTIIELGKSGYESLRPKNNHRTYATILAKQTGQSTVFNFVEAYRQRFLPTVSDNEWFKNNTKAYIVESKSLIPEVLEKQNTATKHSKYAVEVYDKITNPSWSYQQMLLPLLTLPAQTIYIISNMNTVSFGSFSRYEDVVNHPELGGKVREKVDQTAIWQRDHMDFWYKNLSAEHKEKMFRSVMNTDGFGMKGNNGQWSWKTLADQAVAIQDFFGPVHKWFRNNGLGAYATGKETSFVTVNLLSQYGAALYTHEMVHNLDSSTYFYGHGRRTGLGAEFFARGLLENVGDSKSTVLGLNTQFTDADSNIRLHTNNPVQRFTDKESIDGYVKGMLDLIYVLDYLEGNALVKQNKNVKKAWFRKIENYYEGVHAGNRVRHLTDEEVARLTTFDSLITESIINRRSYMDSGNFKRNYYDTVSMLSPIYSALDNPNGAPGDIMFKRMAYELWAAKGYDKGFIPYVSNQLASKGPGKVVSDTLVLQEVFGGTYTTWNQFKQAMYQERIDQLPKLKPITIEYELGKSNSTNKVTIASYQDLERLMAAAIEEDSKRLAQSTSNVNNSWVHKLKQKVYSAYLRSTDDFRTSIFNP